MSARPRCWSCEDSGHAGVNPAGRNYDACPRCAARAETEYQAVLAARARAAALAEAEEARPIRAAA